jgi:hypothetical protein
VAGVGVGDAPACSGGDAVAVPLLELGSCEDRDGVGQGAAREAPVWFREEARGVTRLRE